ncbi:MAG: helix-turn-helix transcriptional regulator [Mycobacterium sp.]
MPRPFLAAAGLGEAEVVMAVGIDRARVGDLLRTRRRALQPEDVGLTRGRRRRTPGLRREEVAALCSMSTAYYGRLERDCGLRPSPAMLATIARALRFSRPDRDLLFSAAGYDVTEHRWGTTHVDPGLMHILGRLEDTAAMAVNPIGEVLHQTRSARALFGDLTGYAGWNRSSYYRWFIDPAERQRHVSADHHAIAADIVADLRRSSGDVAAAHLIGLLLDRSEEFRWHWQRPATGVTDPGSRRCRIAHRDLGTIDLHREMLCNGDRSQRIVVYLATPGTESQSKLELISVIGHHRFPA